ncbi:NAD kinase [Pikeienuella piscinae]|uniref:NAD kinase n=1 Tax=Pikeienuella piscinae TaxID=2748098 RepID=A0A7L5BT74_9RHOB|nr:NAD kinase [Pikeienuella piscinae]QIE54715.1 NAD kinase [Pikeienuella piscinae]
MAYDKIHFTASNAPSAQEALTTMTGRYGQVAAAQADVIVALGGDGFMLHTLHDTLHLEAPVYGMNRGSVGFMMNDYGEDDIHTRLNAAERTTIFPLRMKATTVNGMSTEALAINEVSLLRMTFQAAKLRISVDGRERMRELICDGALIATPAGSTAYNLSAHGPILPIESKLMALTPISAFRPRRWRGAVLPQDAVVLIEALEESKRPILAVADSTEVRQISKVEVSFHQQIEINLLYDPGHGLNERILKEQFLADG